MLCAFPTSPARASAVAPTPRAWASPPIASTPRGRGGPVAPGRPGGSGRVPLRALGAALPVARPALAAPSGSGGRRGGLQAARGDAGEEAPSRTPPRPPTRVLISTGDVSGDLHAALVTREIQALAASAGLEVDVMALAGGRTANAGGRMLGDNTGLSSIGLKEALPLVLPSLKLQKEVRRRLAETPPDVAIFIDYPGVNIPFAKYIRDAYPECKNIYYIPPNEWLWNSARTSDIIANCDSVLAVYPAEAHHFRAAGGQRVKFVGHPLVDTVRGKPGREEARRALGCKDGEVVVMLTPASRRQEVKLVWPYIAGAAKLLRERVPDPSRLRFILATPPEAGLRAALRAAAGLEGFQGFEVFEGDPHTVMAASDLALTKSGTVNVELALFNVPQVVCYKVGRTTAMLAKKIFKINLPYISLVNVIMERGIVPEFIQDDCDREAICEAALELLPQGAGGGGRREEMLQGYELLVDEYMGGGGAGARAASHVLAAVGVGKEETLPLPE